MRLQQGWVKTADFSKELQYETSGELVVAEKQIGADGKPGWFITAHYRPHASGNEDYEKDIGYALTKEHAKQLIHGFIRDERMKVEKENREEAEFYRKQYKEMHRKT